MICPSCGGQGSKVLESRIADAGDAMRRRRECTDCESRYTTYERAEQPTLWVHKSDGRKEPFDCDKLLRGLKIACSKREVPVAELDALVRQVESSLRGDLRAGGCKNVKSEEVGKQALAGLVRIDEAAAIRFASVIHGAESLHAFRAVLEQMEARVHESDDSTHQRDNGFGGGPDADARTRGSLAVV